MNIYQEEIKVLRENRIKLKELLKNKNLTQENYYLELISLFDTIEKELLNEYSEKRDDILVLLPLLYLNIYLK